MANRHYKSDKEFEIQLNFKVCIEDISNYRPLTSEEINNRLEELEIDIKEYFEHLVVDRHFKLELDYGFDILSVKTKSLRINFLGFFI